MRSFTIFTSLAFLILTVGDAQAYLDPGTGSIILQATVATVASSLFVIKAYWCKLKGMLGLRGAADSPEDETSAGQ